MTDGLMCIDVYKYLIDLTGYLWKCLNDWNLVRSDATEIMIILWHDNAEFILFVRLIPLWKFGPINWVISCVLKVGNCGTISYVRLS